MEIPYVKARIKGYKISEIKSFNCSKNTKFQVASISKILTSLLVLKFVELKKLELNKNVNEYLKNFKVRNKKGNLVKITLKELLSHTSGINVSGFPGYNYNSRIPSIKQILNGVKPCNTDKIYFKSQVGKYSYSGGGYMILQQILEDITNKKYGGLIKKYIFTPLKMKNSDFKLRRSKNYRRYPEKAAAGLWSTAEDICKLLIEIQSSLLGKSNKVLSKKSLKLMISPITRAERIFMGLGIFITKNKKGFLHGGHNYKFRTKIKGNFKNGNARVIMINSDKLRDLKRIKKIKSPIEGLMR